MNKKYIFDEFETMALHKNIIMKFLFSFKYTSMQLLFLQVLFTSFSQSCIFYAAQETLYKTGIVCTLIRMKAKH